MDSGNEQVIKSMTATDLHLILKNVTRVTTACADLKADATNCKATNRLSTSPVFFFLVGYAILKDFSYLFDSKFTGLKFRW